MTTSLSFISQGLQEAYTAKIKEELERSIRLWDILCPDTRTDEQKAIDRAAYDREKFATEWCIV